MFLDEIIRELSERIASSSATSASSRSSSRRARRAQNPRTLQKVEVPPKRVVKFKVGRVMRADRVSDGLSKSEGARCRRRQGRGRIRAPEPAARLLRLERLLRGRPIEVVGVLDADRKSQEPSSRPRAARCSAGIDGVGHRRRVLDQRLDAAEGSPRRRRASSRPRRACRAPTSPFTIERDHAAELRASAASPARAADGSAGRGSGPSRPRWCSRGTARAAAPFAQWRVHAQVQRLGAAQHEEAVHWGRARRRPRSGGRRAARASSSSFSDQRAADDVGVAAEVLGHAVQHDVEAQLERPLQVGRREGVVARPTCAPAACASFATAARSQILSSGLVGVSVKTQLRLGSRAPASPRRGRRVDVGEASRRSWRRAARRGGTCRRRGRRRRPRGRRRLQQVHQRRWWRRGRSRSRARACRPRARRGCLLEREARRVLGARVLVARLIGSAARAAGRSNSGRSGPSTRR